jgi:hypothetical protein
MTFGAEIWGPPLIAAAASITGGYLAGRNNGQETKIQKKKRKLVDELINSLHGEGPYSDLYSGDQETFQKSFVDPAKSIFNNQVAPQIQQQYIASGQQRSSGLDDQLLRAGVDLDQLLNQHMYQFQQDAMNRKQGTINSILGGGDGGTQNMSPKQSFGQATAGYLSSDAFADSVAGLSKQSAPQQQTNMPNPYAPPPRKGFTPEWSDWKVGDPRWGNR